MDLKSKHLMDFLNESIQHLDTSGFELLEILDVRSQLASREPLLNDDDKMMLEQLDLELLQSANDVSMRINRPNGSSHWIATIVKRGAGA